MTEASRCECPSSCWSPSPFSVVLPAVPPIRNPRAFRRVLACLAADKDPARAAVARSPREVADPLEAEHRVEDVERDHRRAVVSVRGRGGAPGRERARVVEGLLEDL